jgi:cytosine/adenosine deaminase-related metal-dependent hydrolase
VADDAAHGSWARAPRVHVNETPGLVCAHHHLYSALARGLPGPATPPESFLAILEAVWWRLDVALDLDAIAASARLGALEALESGCTAVVDHHESPNAIEGSLDVIADACAEVGVRVSCAYGVTDRHGADGARLGLAENERFARSLDPTDARRRAMVGVHAAFTCRDSTLVEAAEVAADLGVGVHIHVAESNDDTDVAGRLAPLATDDWLLVHGVHLADDHGLPGTIVHNPRSNMNNGVGYARPTRFSNPVALGSDGIGASMLDEFRLAFARLREADVTASADQAWSWLEEGWALFPEALGDRVRWSYESMEPWALAYTTDVRPLEVQVDDEVVWRDGAPTRVDAAEIRTKANEAATRLAKEW